MECIKSIRKTFRENPKGLGVRHMTSIAHLREVTAPMSKDEMREHLLGVILDLLPAAADVPHEVDGWGIHLTPSERVILAMLFDAKGVVTYDQIYAALTAHNVRGDLPEMQIIKVYVANIRKKLPSFRGKIVTHWARGYSFQKWDKERGYV